MKTLLILRHAKAVPKDPNLSDHDRPLDKDARPLRELFLSVTSVRAFIRLNSCLLTLSEVKGVITEIYMSTNLIVFSLERGYMGLGSVKIQYG